MAKGNSGGRRAAAAAAPAPPRIVSNVPQNAQPMTDQDADALRKQEDSAYDASTTAAVKMYISNTNFDGQGHSLSQAMNYALENGVDFANDDVATINSKLGTRFDANDVASIGIGSCLR